VSFILIKIEIKQMINFIQLENENRISLVRINLEKLPMMDFSGNHDLSLLSRCLNPQTIFEKLNTFQHKV